VNPAPPEGLAPSSLGSNQKAEHRERGGRPEELSINTCPFLEALEAIFEDLGFEFQELDVGFHLVTI
jgi:hypothetical protein